MSGHRGRLDEREGESVIQAQSQKDMTSGQVAKLIGCAPRTVYGWATKGLLECYRVPGSPDRRFRREDVVKFMAAHNIKRDVPGFSEPRRPEPPRVLYVGFTPSMRGELARDGVIASFCQPGPFAGLALADFSPRVVVVDSAIGRIESAQTAAAARSVGALTVLYGGDEMPKGEYHAMASRPVELDAVIAGLAEGRAD